MKYIKGLYPCVMRVSSAIIKTMMHQDILAAVNFLLKPQALGAAQTRMPAKKKCPK
jgi:hypothetical protein